jgi:hypothetical protein
MTTTRLALYVIVATLLVVLSQGLVTVAGVVLVAGR